MERFSMLFVDVWVEVSEWIMCVIIGLVTIFWRVMAYLNFSNLENLKRMSALERK